MPETAVTAGLRHQVRFQARHAGSIPVARSSTAVASEGSSTTTSAGSAVRKGASRMSPRHGRRRGWRLAIASAVVAAAGTLSPFASTATTAAPSPDANSTACANRVNNTPKKLVDCVNKDDLWSYMVKFQQIAD